jgi:uncharacterized membrane protein
MIHWLWEAEARQPLRFNLIVGALLAASWIFLIHFVSGWGAVFGAIGWVTLYPVVRVLGWREGGRQRQQYARDLGSWGSM